MVESIINEKLPSKYITKHSLMLYLYDILIDILNKADKYNLSETTFKFSDGRTKITNLTFKEIEEKEDIELGVALTERHILFSILTDMCYYLYESLSCIERGKVTVAYTLARKPLQDNLYYLCWLLDNPADFYEKMKNNDPKEYDVSELKSQKKSVIAMYDRILKMTNKEKSLPFEPFSAEFLYELIYDRKSNRGLSQIFDKSVHLVTNNLNYKTERQNLNFIFADDEIWNKYWEYYYSKFPYIVFFIVEVVLKNFERMLLIPRNICEINSLIRTLKFCIVYNPHEKRELEEYLNFTIKNSLTIICGKCGNNVLDNVNTIREFEKEYLYSCAKCGDIERIGQYFIPEELLTESIVCEVELNKNLYKLKSKYKQVRN